MSIPSNGWETSSVASFARFGEEPRVGSIGAPIPGVAMKLINDDWSDVPDTPAAIGEMANRGHNVMKGYYRRPAATAEASGTAGSVPATRWTSNSRP